MDVEEWIKAELIPGMVQRNDIGLQANENNFGIHEIEINHITPDGTFMLTKPYKVKLTLVDSQRTTFKTLHLVAKVTPNIPKDIYIGCQFDFLFENEAIGYTEIIPLLDEAAKYPRYYYSHRQHMKAVLVLGDFSIHGWKMAPKVINLPLDHILLAVQELANFHASNYALKHKTPEKFKKIVGKLKESRFACVVDPVWNAMMKIGPKRATKSIRESKHFKKLVPEEFLQQVEHVLSEPWHYGKKSVIPEEPLAVICHGDYLRNNLAFKYDDENNKHQPKSIMMFDFQTLRYSSPMVDLGTFFANSTGYEVRSKHFDEIFKAYHDKLMDVYCKKLDKDPDCVPDYFRYASFLKEFTKKYLHGFCIASSFLNILHEPSDDTFEQILADNSMDTQLKDAETRGGESVNKELCGMIYELYCLHEKFNLQLE